MTLDAACRYAVAAGNRTHDREEEMPNLKAYAERLKARPACREAFAA